LTPNVVVVVVVVVIVVVGILVVIRFSKYENVSISQPIVIKLFGY